MRNLPFYIAIAALSGTSLARDAGDSLSAPNVDEAFKDPAKQFRPKFRYWLPDGSVPADVVRRDIASVAEVGGGGMEFVPFYLYGLPTGGTPPTDWNQFSFGSPAYKDLLKAALEETRDRDLVMDIGQGASQGQGVPSEPRTPGLAIELIYGTADLAAGSPFEGPLPQPVEGAFLHGFMHEPERFGEPVLKTVLAGSVDEATVVMVRGQPTNQIVLNEASIVDITDRVSNNGLEWAAPAGNSTWKIIAFYENYTNQRSCSGAVGATDIIANGSWIVDHFSVDGAKRITDFWDVNLLDTQDIRDLVTSVGQYFWEDSMEMQSTLFWTPSFSERFEKNRGYNLTRFLPLLFDISNQWGTALAAYNESWVYGANRSTMKAAVLADYRTTLTEGYQEYLGHFVNWTRALGVQYSSQPGYNLPLDMSAVIPVVDAPETESLGFPTEDSMRQFTGAALLAGKSVISTEVGAVAGPSYAQTVPELLNLFKKSFAAGVSQMVIHGFAYTGEYTLTNWPGYNGFLYSFGEMWNDKTPSWAQIKDAFDFTARVSLILQAGQPQTDIAFYNYAAPWSSSTKFQSSVLGDLGFSYDYLGPENLSPTLEVKNGVLAPAGPSYLALVISNETAISGSVINAIESYAREGLPVFLIGEWPSACLGVNACPDGKPTTLLQSILSRQQSIHALPDASGLPAALRGVGITPRTAFQTAPDSWYTTWRKARDGAEDYVFVYNGGHTATVQTSFSVSPASAPYILDAWTGERSPVLEYEQTNSGITIPIRLEANQSRIYAFSARVRPAKIHVTSSTGSVSGIYLTGNGSLEARVTGPASFTLSDGRVITTNSSSIHAQSLTAWDLSLTSYIPAHINSTATAFKTIRRPSQPLAPWNQIHGLEFVSGIGEYNTTFDFPYDPAAVGAALSFGPIKDTLRAWVNGQQAPPIDVTDPWVDITQFLKQGSNSVHVAVTSTLFNAVKARANSTMMVSTTAAMGNPTFLTAALAEFGLIGPVVLKPLRRIPLS